MSAEGSVASRAERCCPHYRRWRYNFGFVIVPLLYLPFSTPSGFGTVIGVVLLVTMHVITHLAISELLSSGRQKHLDGIFFSKFVLLRSVNLHQL